MMGSESSHLSGLKIEEDAVEAADFWTHYQATIKDNCRYFSLKCDDSVSVFIGQAALGPLWTVSSPLEKFSNNLLKYRHPCIIRYISAWQQRSTMHLATEFVQPLSQILMSQTPLQRCIGVNNILRALVFLHDQAGMSHNNVSVSAIYVTGDGQWKLGGLQYLCSFSEMTTVYLKQARIHRYDKAVDPNEDSYEITTKVDQYAFAVLVEDVFKGRNDDEVPHLKEFRNYCRDCLQHSDPTKRPNLSQVLQHNFFNHEFISIYKFLNFLPLKTEDEKSEFFANIVDNLKCYDEVTVAKQLGGFLLSRLTMLDHTARRDVIPYILKPNNERLPSSEHLGLFSLSVYKEHIKPRVMQLFGVRDSQIRMLLLTHFSKFVHVFSHEELSQHILPELLLGIKDINDNLVASTLICLSEIVPVLGAETVIGGKRYKFFTDGRPNSKTNLATVKSTDDLLYLSSKPLRAFHCSEDVFENNRETSAFEKTMSLNERPSPVGGESVDENVLVAESIKNHLGYSEDDWSDWDNSKPQITIASDNIDLAFEGEKSIEVENKCTAKHTKTDLEKDSLNRMTLLQRAALEAKKNIVDISELDIKNQKFDSSKKGSEEIDFFADMAPVIEKTVPSVAQDVSGDFSSKLNFIPSEGLDESEGWEDNWND